jgi:hypothetical protein
MLQTLVAVQITSEKLSVPCKIWGFRSCDCEECLLGYKNPVRTSQETHYISTTEPDRLMLCKIWSVHGDDYEECRLLGYKNPVRTSQETHYVSVTEPSRLILCKIEVFTAVTVKNAVFWDVTPYRSCQNASKECITSIIRVERISDLETLAVTSN